MLVFFTLCAADENEIIKSWQIENNIIKSWQIENGNLAIVPEKEGLLLKFTNSDESKTLDTVPVKMCPIFSINVFSILLNFQNKPFLHFLLANSICPISLFF